MNHPLNTPIQIKPGVTLVVLPQAEWNAKYGRTATLSAKMREVLADLPARTLKRALQERDIWCGEKGREALMESVDETFCRNEAPRNEATLKECLIAVTGGALRRRIAALP